MTGLYPQSVRRGALYLIGSALVFSGVGYIIKTLLRDLPLEMVVFFRNAMALLFIIPLVLARPAHSLRTRRLLDHFMRALFGVMAMYCFFFAISKLPLAEAVTLNFTSPLLIPLLAYLVLGEKIPGAIAGLLVLGFLGACLVMKPGAETFQPAAVLGLLSAFFAAFALVNIRKLASTEPAYRIVFYFSMMGSLITVIPMLRVWKSPDLHQWIMLVAVGGSAALGQWFLTRGYASAPASKVGYFQYSAVLFAGLLDWSIWHVRPDGYSFLGMGLIMAAGIVASRSRGQAAPDKTDGDELSAVVR